MTADTSSRDLPGDAPPLPARDLLRLVETVHKSGARDVDWVACGNAGTDGIRGVVELRDREQVRTVLAAVLELDLRVEIDVYSRAPEHGEHWIVHLRAGRPG